MQHDDAQLSEITIVLKKHCAELIDQMVEELRKLQMAIDEIDSDNGVVEGTVAVDNLAKIRSWPCVEYVRVEFTYIADYPPGDPRNLDAPDEEPDDRND